MNKKWIFSHWLASWLWWGKRANMASMALYTWSGPLSPGGGGDGGCGCDKHLKRNTVKISLIDIPHTSYDTAEGSIGRRTRRIGLNVFIHPAAPPPSAQLYDVMKGFMSIKLAKTYINDAWFQLDSNPTCSNGNGKAISPESLASHRLKFRILVCVVASFIQGCTQKALDSNNSRKMY